MFPSHCVNEGLLVESSGFDDVPNDVIASNRTVRGQGSMEIQEHQEVPVVVESNALVDPYAVVIELLYTGLAHAAVFRSSWLVDLACLTFVLLFKHDAIILETSDRLEMITWLHIGLYWPQMFIFLL